MANYFCKMFSPTLYPLATIHPLPMTDDGRTTTMKKAWSLLKYSWLIKTAARGFQFS